MNIKIAWRNVRRSAKDYAIYFITLLFGVAMFYAFNSISGQSVLMDIRQSDAESIISLTNRLLDIFSIVVVAVLAFLVTYANRFIIRRRRREFGTYLLLGMGTGSVARVLLYEMVLVGLASLVIGLAVGIGLSQGFAFITAHLLGTTMSHYRFLVSTQAILLTLGCFAGIFAITLVMNVIYVSKTRISTLLQDRLPQKEAKRIRVWFRVIVFILAVLLLIQAYWCLSENSFNDLKDRLFIEATVLMLVGTALFFWSGASAAMAVFSRSKGFYLRGLRPFTLRELSSRFGAASTSLTVVCVLLFFAVTTMSVGFGFVRLFVDGLEEATRYDATIHSCVATVNPYSRTSFDTETDYSDAAAVSKAYAKSQAELKKADPDRFAAWRKNEGDIRSAMEGRCPEWKENVKAAAQLDFYTCPGLTWAKAIPDTYADTLEDGDMETLETLVVEFIGVSQFNESRSLLGEPTIVLEEDEYALDNNFQATEKLAKRICEDGLTLSFAGENLSASGKPIPFPLSTQAVSAEMLKVIVPDSTIENLKELGALPNESFLNIEYRNGRTGTEDAFNAMLAEAFSFESGVAYDAEGHQEFWPVENCYTASYMINQASGLQMAITYLSVFIGLVMLITVAAVLAIQQLSETADTAGRYRRLATLGADESMIYGSLKKQAALYFLTPLALALCHTTCAVIVCSNRILASLGISPLAPMGRAALILVLVYGCYLLITYKVSKNIVREAMRGRTR